MNEVVSLPGRPKGEHRSAKREGFLVTDRLLDERGFSKLRWRCRRGLLENDLFIERFFGRYQATLTEIQAQGLLALMDLPDNDLLDLLLRRTEPEGALAAPEVREVLGMLRTPLPASAD